MFSFDIINHPKRSTWKEHRRGQRKSIAMRKHFFSGTLALTGRSYDLNDPNLGCRLFKFGKCQNEKISNALS